jgi:hypothetical protein
VTTPAPASPASSAAQPSGGQAPAPAAHGWEAVWIVLVGAFMALLDASITA